MFDWKIPLAKAEITADDVTAVTQSLRSGIVSNGPKIAEFEELFAAYVGAKHAVAVNSGTSGLHLSMIAAGISVGDEVVTSPFSFIASANCAEMVGAKPVFSDIDAITLNMDPRGLAANLTEQTKAIVSVDVFGLSADAAALCGSADTYGLTVIEDACEALGATVQGIKVGSCRPVPDPNQPRESLTAPLAAVFGFYANKQLTTGEGGMITTNDDAAADLFRSLRNQGRSTSSGQAASDWLRHDLLGFAYRMTELSAALGISQLLRFDQTLARRRQVAEHYRGRLRPLNAKFVLPVEVAGYVRSWFVFPIICREGVDRDKIVANLEQQGIQCGRYFSPPIHLQEIYRQKYGYEPGQFPVAEGIANQIFAVPFFTEMTADQVDRVCDALARAIQISN